MKTTQIIETCTVVIKKSGVDMKKFENVESDSVAFGWMLRNQSNSIDHALKYEGWTVEVINDQTKESTFWEYYKPVKRK